MATRTPTLTRFGDNVVVFTYEGLLDDDVGAPIPPQYADYADRSVHIFGTFDSATVVWQGSNNGSSYLTLTDPQGNGISKTAEAIEQVTEGALFQRPSTSGGAASQDLDVVVVCRKGPRPMGAV